MLKPLLPLLVIAPITLAVFLAVAIYNSKRPDGPGDGMGKLNG